MSSIGERLKEERKRLGLNQDDFAVAGGVQRRAQTNYEKDERAPDADYLSKLSTIGVDVQFVITGERSVARLSALEVQLLAAFNGAPLAVQNAALAALLSGTVPNASPKMIVHGDVGQTVKGNVTIEGGFSMGGRKK